MKLTDLALPKVTSASEVNHVTNNFPESDLPFYRKLGRTDLTVSCLGLGGGGSISSEDTLYAFERGINYFFYSSDLFAPLYLQSDVWSIAPALWTWLLSARESGAGNRDLYQKSRNGASRSIRSIRRAKY